MTRISGLGCLRSMDILLRVGEPGSCYLAIQGWPVASSAARASPNAMRYQANTSNERCDTKRTSHRTTTSALANDSTNPVANTSAAEPHSKRRLSHEAWPLAANI